MIDGVSSGLMRTLDTVTGATEVVEAGLTPPMECLAPPSQSFRSLSLSCSPKGWILWGAPEWLIFPSE